MMVQQKPTGFMRLWFRFPVYIYRLGLGWIAGHQFLLLTHRGRRTGLLHQTVLKTLYYDAITGEVIVIAQLGERANWLRNIGRLRWRLKSGTICSMSPHLVCAQRSSIRYPLAGW